MVGGMWVSLRHKTHAYLLQAHPTRVDRMQLVPIAEQNNTSFDLRYTYAVLQVVCRQHESVNVSKTVAQAVFL
jgi:hypothetical protein